MVLFILYRSLLRPHHYLHLLIRYNDYHYYFLDYFYHYDARFSCDQLQVLQFCQGNSEILFPDGQCTTYTALSTCIMECPPDHHFPRSNNFWRHRGASLKLIKFILLCWEFQSPHCTLSLGKNRSYSDKNLHHFWGIHLYHNRVLLHGNSGRKFI